MKILRFPAVAWLALFTLPMGAACATRKEARKDEVSQKLSSLPGADKESDPEVQERRFGIGAAEARTAEDDQRKQDRSKPVGGLGSVPIADANAPVGAEKPRAPIDLMWMVAPAVEAEVPTPAPANTAALRSQGAKLFTKNCAACHGKRGDGEGSAAGTLSVRPPDFTKGIFKIRSTPSGSLPTDADLYATISRGLHGTEMFPWTQLAVRDRWALVQRVKSFSPRFRQEQAGEPFVLSLPAPAESVALQARGKALYERLRCGACHGATGGADGPAVDLYKDPTGQRVVYIRDFRQGQFLRGGELKDIVMTLRTGLDGTPMGPYDSLAERDLWSLAAYVRTLVQQRPIKDNPGAVQ